MKRTMKHDKKGSLKIVLHRKMRLSH